LDNVGYPSSTTDLQSLLLGHMCHGCLLCLLLPVLGLQLLADVHLNLSQHLDDLLGLCVIECSRCSKSGKK
jgi:hypothetical protein